MTRPPMFARPIPFVPNTRTALVLAFTDHVMTVAKNGAPVLVAGSPYSLVTPYAEADLASLAFVQSGNDVYLVHPSYAVRKLTRTADDDWAIAAVTFGATIAAPTLPAIGAYSVDIDEDLFGWVYVVTAIGDDGEESLASTTAEVADAADANHPIVVSWTGSTGAQSYRIYRRPPKQSGSDVGAFGFVGVSSTTRFVDYARDPDFAQQPPIEKTVFASADNYPSACGFWQQRLLLANTNTDPDTVWASQTARPTNFNVSLPSKDDDAATFKLLSDTVDEIRHILSLGRLTLLTEGGEWPVLGDQSGVLTPAAINTRKESSHGTGTVRPTQAGSALLLAQALGSTILELSGDGARDLTLLSTHLFDGHQIVDMAWQQEPPHVAWFVRDDGVLLGLTYVPDQDVLAWHRHDLDGVIESVCVVPEVIGSRIEHRVYVCVARTSGGTVTHTLEHFVSPFTSAPAAEAWYVDGGVEYDGRFSLTGSDTVSGLDHLEGRDVAVYGYSKIVDTVPDGIGYVVANPLRADLTVVTVSGGAITLPDSYLRIVVGLPFISDLETLDIDGAAGPSLKTQRMNIDRVGVQLADSRNIWAGGAVPSDATPTSLMDPLTLATDDDANDLVTDYAEITTRGQWNTNGRVALRSIDPTPLTVLSIVPRGYIPSPQES